MRFSLSLFLLTLTVSAGSALAEGVTLKAGYNLRQKPSVESRRLGVLTQPTKAKVVSMGRHWALVEIQGRRTYVSTQSFDRPVYQNLPETGPVPQFRPTTGAYAETPAQGPVPQFRPETETAATSIPDARPEELVPVPEPEEPASVWNRVPENNWARVDVRTLNLRKSPSADSASMGQLRQGARVAVIESQLRDGRRWHRVMPFDCGDRHFQQAEQNACGSAVWIAADYVVRTDRPSEEERNESPTSALSENAETEGQACTDCATGAASDLRDLQNLSDLGDVIAATREITPPAPSGKSLYEEYQEFHRSYVQRHPVGRNKTKWARENKTRFLSSLILTFGVEKAGKMITALTAYGEARGVSTNNEWRQIAEMSFVAQIIKNRAEGGFRDDTYGEPLRVKHQLSSARHERDLWGEKGAPIRVALANSQFSTWNSNDSNLDDVMLARDNPYLARAFKSVRLLEEGAVRPVGDLAKPSTDHYHASWMRAWWARRMNRVTPKMETPAGVIEIRAHRAYR